MSLLGAAALLLWGLRMVRTGVLRAYGGDLRRGLGRSMGNRFSAFFAGLGITTLLQSSTATALMAASFASKGLVSTTAALAIMLGADVGTSLVAQVFSLPLDWLSPLLVLVGVAVFMGAKSTRWRDLGRTAVGLGIVLLALKLIALTAEPMRQSEILTDVRAALGGELVIALVVAALLTVLSTSSLAVILLVISLVSHGVIAVPLGFSGELRGVISCVQVRPGNSTDPDPPGFTQEHLLEIHLAASLLGRLIEHEHVRAAPQMPGRLSHRVHLVVLSHLVSHRLPPHRSGARQHQPDIALEVGFSSARSPLLAEGREPVVLRRRRRAPRPGPAPRWVPGA